MAKILVADDNSNIQKMVGLVLKDQGIDVVAVGNGEAAVRKISDVRPDLVLADVFMPVRNGYEVCKFVKGDSSLAHIPVILLVGAFDPLDEEEAQRVGADGVLKKPFVPPDPLISMVKSALVRASTGNAAGNAAKPANKGTTATVTSLDGGNVPTMAAQPSQAGPGADSFVDEVPAKPPELKIDSDGRPLAFGNLLETPGTSDTGDVSAYVNTPKLERDWGSGEVEPEEEEEESEGAWRPETTGVLSGEEETAAEKRTKAKREAWTPTREKQQDLLEAGTEPDFVTEVPAPKAPEVKMKVEPPAPKVVQPPPQKISEPATPKPPAPPSGMPGLGAMPTPPPPSASKTPVPPQKPPVDMPVSKTVADSPAALPAKPAPPLQKASPPSPLPPSAPQPPLSTAPAPPQGAATPKEPEKPAGAQGSWFSISASPWEASGQPANAAPGWDAPAAPVSSGPIELTSAAPSTRPAPAELEPEPSPTGFYTNSSTLPELVSGGESISPATVETLRQEATQVIEESSLQRAQATSPAKAEKAPVAAPPDVDDLVAKVLAKLDPEALQAVTREILKPVVEAMVREELKTKKS